MLERVENGTSMPLVLVNSVAADSLNIGRLERGDELIAMWGAPVDQPDHATLSARAAVDMLAAVPRINERWAATLGETMDLGIGINSGVARVGNTGSRHKFKYGPLGNTVNLASRVQGATKYVRSRILVTDATRSRMGSGFASRRVCQVRVVNIAEPVERLVEQALAALKARRSSLVLHTPV
jgi:adenylate cyclase